MESSENKVEKTEQEVEESDDESTSEREDTEKESSDARISRLERENKRLHRKVGQLEALVPKEQPKQETKSDEFGLLQKTYLRAAGITAEDEVELARDIQKKTGINWDKLVDDDYFKSKLEGLRTAKANVEATSNVSGGKGSAEAKNDAAYWISKGVPPTREQVSDRKTRAKIARAMIEHTKTGKKFWNE